MKRETVLGIFLYAAIAAGALVCLFLYNRVSDMRTAEQAEMVRSAFLGETVSRYNREQGEIIFRELVDEVRQAFPGFACWGDDCMVGKGSLNLPAALEDGLYRSLYAALSEDFTRCAGIKVALTGLIPAHNLGFPGEGLMEVMARSGASGIFVQETFSIPRSTDPVAISLVDGAGHALGFDGQNYARLGRVAIGGIRGYCYPGSKAVDSRGARLAFGRELGGEPANISAGTPVLLDSADRFTGCLPILFFREPADLTPSQVAGGMAAIVNRHHPLKGQCMVLCVTPRDSDMDRALKASFGEHYIRVESDPLAMQTSDYTRLADTLLIYLDMQGALDDVHVAVSKARESLCVLAAQGNTSR